MTSLILLKYPQSKLDLFSPDDLIPLDGEIGLTETGMEKASQIAEALVSSFDGVFQVWSGSARRCREPAEVLAEATGTEPTVDSRLDERRIFEGAGITVREFRTRQERGYLDPSRLAEGEIETPLSHRLRTEGWLAEVLGRAAADDVYVVVSHGAVIEHLHSALSSKPPGSMESSFTFCAPGNAHVWSDVVLPDLRRIWCCLGANIDLTGPSALDKPRKGLEDLNGLAVDLASDPRFRHLVQSVAQDEEALLRPDVYYIR